MDVHHLRVISAIADAQSFSRAALALGVTQPAVSAQLKRLENMLGYRLFERSAGVVIPTPMGEMLLRRTLALLPQVDKLLDGIEQRVCSVEPPRVVRVASVASVLVACLPSLVGRFWPEVSETSVVHDDHAERLLALLAQRRVELALIKDYPGSGLDVPAGVEAAVIVTEPTFVLLPESHRLARRELLDLGDLRREPWVLLSDSSATTMARYFTSVCAKHGFSPLIVHQVTSQQVVPLMVRAGAVGLSDPTCDPPIPGVVIRPLRGDVLLGRHVIAWRKGTFVAGRQADLIAALVTAYQDEAMAAPVYARHLATRSCAE